MVWMPGGGGGCAAVGNAAMAVETGQAEVVVVYRSLCQGQFFRFGTGGLDASKPVLDPPRPTVNQAISLMMAGMGYAMPYGLIMAAAALRAADAPPHAPLRHDERAARTHRGDVPRPRYAQPARGDGQQADDARRPPGVADDRGPAPSLRLLSRERRRVRGRGHHRGARARSRARPIEILASEQGAPKGFAFGPFTNANVADEIYATGACEEMAGRLYRKAGVGPADVDVAQIYDHFTGCVLMQIEDYGFCKRGEGGPFIESGALRWQRRQPADQHARRQPLRGVHPRAQPRRRRACARCAATPRIRSRAPRCVWSRAQPACRRAR
jgi:hypothetical protein